MKRTEVTITTREVIEKTTTKSFSINQFTVILEQVERDGELNESIYAESSTTKRRYTVLIALPEELLQMKRFGLPVLETRYIDMKGLSPDESALLKSASEQLRARRGESPSFIFNAMINEKYNFIPVFFSNYDHSMYVAPENKFYQTLFISYIGANLSNLHYDLEKVLQTLKDSQDPNLLLMTKKVIGIPSYNRSSGQSETLEFRYCLEIPEVDVKRNSYSLNEEVMSKLGLEKFRYSDEIIKQRESADDECED